MFNKNSILLFTLLFCNRSVSSVQLTKVKLICEAHKSSYSDSTKHCNIICELPSTVKFDDHLDIEQVIGIQNDEIKSPKSLLSIQGDRMTENLPENIGNVEANFTSYISEVFRNLFKAEVYQANGFLSYERNHRT